MRSGRPALAVLAVAVAVAAGCTSGTAGPDMAGVPTSAGIDVAATEMAFSPELVAVPAGPVTVRLVNDGTVRHDLRIEQVPFLVEANAGESSTGTVVLEPGRYELFCALPGHRDAGMTGFLEVR